jgi:hypothetical protein
MVYNSPLYPQGIHSKTRSGYQKSWITQMLYALCFFCMPYRW